VATETVTMIKATQKRLIQSDCSWAVIKNPRNLLTTLISSFKLYFLVNFRNEVSSEAVKTIDNRVTEVNKPKYKSYLCFTSNKVFHFNIRFILVQLNFNW